MPYKIEELKKQWETDKETYKTKELGGLQEFVSNVFECSELFNIKRGSESAKDKNRRNEYIRENSKNQRRADFVIFYKGNEIVIPVEVEKYENIKAGIGQLANYQNDYQKSYGILTDGFEWRFYNNTVYKSFTLTEMFERPSELKTFWEDYLKEENYYLNFFEGINTHHLNEESLNVESNKELFFEDITNLIQRFKDKLGLVGYLKEKGTSESDKKATEIAYAYFIQFILYKNLVDNCYAEFDDEFKKRINTIYTGLKTQAYQLVLLQIYSISQFISDKIYKPFNKEQEYINQKLSDLLLKPDTALEKISLWLDIIVFIKKYNFANLKNEIFGYIYENYLKELYSDKNKGQYFTDPAIVNFMLDEIGYTVSNIKKNLAKNELLSIIDPACGSGTFLYSAVDRIVSALFDGSKESAERVEKIINDNVFGLDIEEFPLYLAEMNILMRMLPIIINKNYTNPIEKKIKIFKTQDSIAEFMDTGITAKIQSDIDETSGQLSLFNSATLDLSYKSYIRDEDDLKEMKTSMRPPRRRYDFVIGNPPYIGYNECCKQKVLFTQLKEEVHMDNIYGINLNTVEGRRKVYSPKPNLYAFFIALGGALLKPNGKMCYIIPQTILTATDLDVLRYYLSSENLTLEKILTFSGNLFIGRGIKGKNPVATSSLIFLVSKKKPSSKSETNIVNFLKSDSDTEIKNILNVKKGKNKTIHNILQSVLAEKIDNWSFINKTDLENSCVKKYIQNTISIDEWRHTLTDYDTVQFDKGTAFDKNYIQEEKEFWHLIKKQKGRIILGTEKYLPDAAVKYPEGSQGKNIFLNKYKIIWSYMNRDDFYFSDEQVMIDFNKVIISSNNENEILFLLAILRSKSSKYILDYYTKLDNEKDVNLGIKTVKQFIRMPIMTDRNKYLKTEIIKNTKNMLKLERCVLSDFVDFSGITIQKFDSIAIQNKNLVLTKNHSEYLVPFSKKADVIFLETYIIGKGLKNIDLNSLKQSPVFNIDEQKKIKDYVDDLIFALYFNPEMESEDFKNKEMLKEKCSADDFYNIIANEK